MGLWKFLAPAIAGIVVLHVSCGSDTKKDESSSSTKASLKVKLAIPAGGVKASLDTFQANLFKDGGTSGTPTAPIAVSFTPEVFKVPVKSVTFGGVSIISCTKTDAECLVDLASESSLQAAAANAATEIFAGTYQEGTFSLCSETEGLTTNAKPSLTEQPTTRPRAMKC